jgi:hypothetical protein
MASKSTELDDGSRYPWLWGLVGLLTLTGIVLATNGFRELWEKADRSSGLGGCGGRRVLRDELEPSVDGWPILTQEIPAKSPALIRCITDQGVPNSSTALRIVGVGKRLSRQWSQQPVKVDHLLPRVCAGEHQAASGIFRRNR